MKKVALVSRVKWGLEALKTMLGFRPNLDIQAVFTLPESESRRHSNHVLFDEICYRNGIALIETLNINDEVNRISTMGLDYLFVFGWSQLITKAVIDSPLCGCIGTHPARLPLGRGRAPVTWQLIKGYNKSALTFFFIDEGTDNGDIIIQRTIPLTLEDTAKTFYDKIIRVGKQCLEEMIPLLLQDKLPRKSQDHSLATYLPRRKPEDGIIDWNKSSFELYNWIRGLTRPFPGAFTLVKGAKMYVWSAKVESYVETGESIGLVKGTDEDGLLVTTGKGGLYLTSIQFEGEEEITDPEDERMVRLVGSRLGLTTGL